VVSICERNASVVICSKKPAWKLPALLTTPWKSRSMGSLTVVPRWMPVVGRLLWPPAKSPRHPRGGPLRDPGVPLDPPGPPQPGRGRTRPPGGPGPHRQRAQAGAPPPTADTATGPSPRRGRSRPAFESLPLAAGSSWSCSRIPRRRDRPARTHWSCSPAGKQPGPPTIPDCEAITPKCRRPQPTTRIRERNARPRACLQQRSGS
jgi:hypothetical protein